jgi:hypothetical protein
MLCYGVVAQVLGISTPSSTPRTCNHMTSYNTLQFGFKLRCRGLALRYGSRMLQTCTSTFQVVKDVRIFDHLENGGTLRNIRAIPQGAGHVQLPRSCLPPMHEYAWCVHT